MRLNDPSPTCVGRKWGSQGDLRLNKGKHTPGPVPQCGRICSYPPSFLGPQHPTLIVVLPFGFLSSRASVWINKALGENCPKRRGIGANSASHTLSDDRADCDIWLPQFLPGFIRNQGKRFANQTCGSYYCVHRKILENASYAKYLFVNRRARVIPHMLWTWPLTNH